MSSSRGQNSADKHGDVYFRQANIAVNDWWVVAGGQQYQIPTIVSAEMATVHHPIDWGKFARRQLVALPFVLVVDVIVAYLGLTRGWGLVVIWLMLLIMDAWDKKKKAIEHTLVLHTLSGRVEVAKVNNGLYMDLVAKEINKRIAQNPISPLARQLGEPTKQIMVS
ncbi:MAG TPA: DUF6232 family protein [Chloroflexia bacterium]|nr:DUF6232 family protein [Chloroflexia bacterium]